MITHCSTVMFKTEKLMFENSLIFELVVANLCYNKCILLCELVIFVLVIKNISKQEHLFYHRNYFFHF